MEESFARLQTSQHELETLLNSMQDAVLAVGADGRVQWANRGMARLLRRSPRLDAPLVDSVRDPDFLTAVQDAARDQVATSTRSNTITPGRTFDVTAAPMPGGGVVAVLRDLTETERMEKTRRDFIANVSHELRTPLTSIQGYTETLLDSGVTDNHVRDFLEIIRKNAARMSRLTEDLLTLARIESGEQRFDIQKVSTEELLQDALESFREVARTYGVELVVENAAPEANVDRRPRSHPPDFFQPHRERAQVRGVRQENRSRRARCIGRVNRLRFRREGCGRIRFRLIQPGNSGKPAQPTASKSPIPVRHSPLNFTSAILALASPPNMCLASSSVSTASTKPAPASREAPASASPSPSTSCSAHGGADSR